MSGYQQGGGGNGSSPTHNMSSGGFGPSNPLSNSGPIAMDAMEFDSSSSSSGPFFHGGDFKKKNEDLKQMLESNKYSLKLEAMKRIIGMVARGRDATDLFPHVVKNVVSKNIEVKKLVYVYLTRYAEDRQDLALLSISTFQRALKDPNQLIRASALRVLSSIRVPVIVPIMMCAIRDSAVDMSPFVRKTAAHAIPKLYSIDPDQKEELVGIIEKLLGDRTTLVVGSAVMAFEEVCPERIELIHKNYRKFCNLLADVEEWGQVVIVNMLTRYARSQFTDPNAFEDMETENIVKEFYENSDSNDDCEEDKAKKKSIPRMDPDHRLLLKSAKPLLQSRNAAVVMASAQLYFHCAPRPEIQIVSKAMIRLLRSHREVQSIVLSSIASMTSEKCRMNTMFEIHLKNFFVRGSDPTHIKILKLEIITNLATEGNIGIILREFQTYITGQDKVCIAATIQAIGRCAATITDVTDTCLNGLVHLLSNQDQAVVAESVVVIKKLLQTQAEDHKEIIIHMAKLMDTIDVPAARAAILWVIGEYSERVANIAPDVLRKVAKTFINEEDQVKMQVLNLSVKLCLTNPKQTKLLTQYIFNLAKYDQNYDIRDRARFLKAFLFPPPGQENNKVIKHAKKIFLAPKPAPVMESKFKGRSCYQLGSMSHFLNTRVQGYHDLPIFPSEAPDPSVRNVEPLKVTNPWSKYSYKEEEQEKSEKLSAKKDSFYSDDGTSDSEESSSDDEDSTSSSESSSDDNKHVKVVNIVVKKNGKKKSEDSSSESSSESSSSSSEDSEEDSSSSDDDPVKDVKSNSQKTNLDLLLDLDNFGGSDAATLTPSLGGFLTPATSSPTVTEAEPMYVAEKTKELLNKMTTGGLQVLYRFTRSPHLYSPAMCNVELTLINHSNEEITDIKVGTKTLSPGMTIHEFPGFPKLEQGASRIVNIGINFNDTTQAAKFDLIASNRCHKVSVSAPVGEIMRAVSMPENLFLSEQSKLKGMNESSNTGELSALCASPDTIKKRIYEVCNVLFVPSVIDEETCLRFVGRTLAKKAFVLISLKLMGNKVTVTINCDNIVIANMLIKDIIHSLSE